MVMAIAEEMKKMTENIIISNDVRLKAVGDIVADTHKTLSGFAADRKKMAAQQAKDLSDFVMGLSKNVQSFLSKFQKDHQQMSKQQAKSLADFVKNMAADVSSMLSDFEKARGEMSEELRNRLAKEIKDIQAHVENLLDEADKMMSEYSSDMAQAKKAWKSMTATLARARKGGFTMPESNAGKKASTVKQATRKAQGKKKSTQKSKSSRQKVGAGV